MKDSVRSDLNYCHLVRISFTLYLPLLFPQFYKGGVMNQPDILCGKDTGNLNHAVLNVGYDYESKNNGDRKSGILRLFFF